MAAGWLVIAALFVSAVAAADPVVDADRDRAANHAKVAQLLYERADYEGALREFQLAKDIVVVPELEYDIARCLERLGRKLEAVDAYERFLAARPDDPGRDGVLARIAELRPPPPKPAPVVAVVVGRPVTRPSILAPSIVAGFTGASVIVGAGLVGYVGGALRKDATGCCTQSDADHLRTDANVGYAFFGIAGALAIVDVALWVRYARGRAR